MVKLVFLSSLLISLLGVVLPLWINHHTLESDQHPLQRAFLRASMIFRTQELNNWDRLYRQGSGSSPPLVYVYMFGKG